MFFSPALTMGAQLRTSEKAVVASEPFDALTPPPLPASLSSSAFTTNSATWHQARKVHWFLFIETHDIFLLRVVSIVDAHVLDRAMVYRVTTWF